MLPTQRRNTVTVSPFQSIKAWQGLGVTFFMRTAGTRILAMAENWFMKMKEPSLDRSQ